MARIDEVEQAAARERRWAFGIAAAVILVAGVSLAGAGATGLGNAVSTVSERLDLAARTLRVGLACCPASSRRCGSSSCSPPPPSRSPSSTACRGSCRRLALSPSERSHHARPRRIALAPAGSGDGVRRRHHRPRPRCASPSPSRRSRRSPARAPPPADPKPTCCAASGRRSPPASGSRLDDKETIDDAVAEIGKAAGWSVATNTGRLGDRMLLLRLKDVPVEEALRAVLSGSRPGGHAARHHHRRRPGVRAATPAQAGAERLRQAHRQELHRRLRRRGRPRRAAGDRPRRRPLHHPSPWQARQGDGPLQGRAGGGGAARDPVAGRPLRRAPRQRGDGDRARRSLRQARGPRRHRRGDSSG